MDFFPAGRQNPPRLPAGHQNFLDPLTGLNDPAVFFEYCGHAVDQRADPTLGKRHAVGTIDRRFHKGKGCAAGHIRPEIKMHGPGNNQRLGLGMFEPALTKLPR